MARSHHRKKHKEQLHHYQHRREQVSGISKKGKSAIPLAIIGAIAGLLIVYLSAGTSIPLVIGGIVLFAAIGYFVGNRMDKAAE
jgi:Flp pilus assembly protein TadB